MKGEKEEYMSGKGGNNGKEERTYVCMCREEGDRQRREYKRWEKGEGEARKKEEHTRVRKKKRGCNSISGPSMR